MDMHKKSKLDFSPVDVANLSFNRMNLFKYLRASLKSYKPNMKLLYGYLMMDWTLIKLSKCYLIR